MIHSVPRTYIEILSDDSEEKEEKKRDYTMNISHRDNLLLTTIRKPNSISIRTHLPFQHKKLKAVFVQGTAYIMPCIILESDRIPRYPDIQGR